MESMRYNTDNMNSKTESDGKPRFLFSGEDAEKLSNDITFLNVLLSPFSHLVPELWFDVTRLSLYPIDRSGPISYSFLWETPFTPAGRPSKYPQVAYPQIILYDYLNEWSNNTFGDIHYLKDGRIGKARLVMWRDGVCYVAYFKIPKGDHELWTWRITRRDEFSDTFLYNLP